MRLVCRRGEDQATVDARADETLDTVVQRVCAAQQWPTPAGVVCRAIGTQPIPLALPLVRSRVPNNALLVFVDAPYAAEQTRTQLGYGALVSVAVQVPGGQRVSGQVACHATLWTMLRALELHAMRSLTYVEEEENGRFLLPVIAWNGAKYSTIPVLCQTSLSRLGIRKGGVLMQLMYEECKMTREQVNTEVSRYDEYAPVTAQSMASTTLAMNTSKGIIVRAAEADLAGPEPRLKASVASTSSFQPGTLERALFSLVEQNPVQAMLALKTVLAIVKNMIKSEDTKFRQINLNSSVLQQRFLQCTGSRAVLEAIGFRQESGDLLKLLPAFDDMMFFEASRDRIQRSLNRQKLQSPLHTEREPAPPPDDRRILLVDKRLATEAISNHESDFDEKKDEDCYLSDAELIRQVALDAQKKVREAAFLVPQSYLKQHATATKALYRVIVIRVQLDPHVCMQALFSPDERARDIYDVVRSILTQSSFRLRFPPSNDLEEASELSLVQHNFAPSVLLYLLSEPVLDDIESIIYPSVFADRVATIPEDYAPVRMVPAVPAQESVNAAAPVPMRSDPTNSARERAVPAWFKR